MSLRRFPWKAPRQADNSFKLFSSRPSPEAEREQGIHHPHSHAHKARHGSTAGEAANTEIATESAHHTTSSASAATVPVAPVEKVAPSGGPPPAPTIRGPWRLMRLLPREARPIIQRMLDLKPESRATLEEIFADDWIKNGKVCSQEEPHFGPNNQFIGGKVLRAEGHEHSLEKSNTSSESTTKVSKPT